MDGLLREGSGPGIPGPYGVAVQQALHFRKRARRLRGVGERQRCPEGLRHLTAAPYLDASRMLSARISPSSVIMEPFLSG